MRHCGLPQRVVEQVGTCRYGDDHQDGDLSPYFRLLKDQTEEIQSENQVKQRAKPCEELEIEGISVDDISRKDCKEHSEKEERQQEQGLSGKVFIQDVVTGFYKVTGFVMGITQEFFFFLNGGRKSKIIIDEQRRKIGIIPSSVAGHHMFPHPVAIENPHAEKKGQQKYGDTAQDGFWIEGSHGIFWKNQK